MPQIDTTRGNAGRSTPAARRRARKPLPPSPKPVQRGHSSEGGRVIAPKRLRPKVTRVERRHRGRSDAAQGNSTSEAGRRARGASDAAQGNSTRAAEPFRRSPAYVKLLRDLALEQGMRRAERDEMGSAAPALAVLEQTSRPIHAVAAAAREDVRDIKAGRLPIGHGSLNAAGRGFALKDKSMFSDVFKEAGVPSLGGLRSVLGFGADVFLDPTTYPTLGTASVGRRVALEAAERTGAAAERAAVRAAPAARAVTEKEAKRAALRAHGGGAAAPSLAERAVSRAERRVAGAPRGVAVRAAGREVPGVTRATAAVGRGARAAGRRVPRGSRAAAFLKHAAADVNPNVVPDGLGRAEYAAIRQATRTARSSASRDMFRARQVAQAVQKAIGKANYQRVLDAIEAGRIGDLPVGLRRPALVMREAFGRALKSERRAGVKVRGRRNYVPHILTDTLEEPENAMGVASVGKRTVNPSSARARKELRPLSEIRETDPGKYIEDPGVVYAARMQENALSLSAAGLNRELADMGRVYRPGMSVAPGQAVYHLSGSNLRKLDPKHDRAELGRLGQRGVTGKGGRYVVLNAQAADRALKTVAPGGERSTLGRALDKVQGHWKLLATQPNPGFHLRNAASDLGNHYLATPGHRVPGNLKHAARVISHVSREEHALRDLAASATERGRGFVTPRYGRVSYARAADELERAGGVRAGFAARELHDLLDSAKTKGKVGERAHRLRRWVNNREDVFRAATAIEAVRRGASWEEAAAFAAKYHFDYSDLTELERKVLRRVMPFYTFSARNIPLQMQSVLTRPGKFAQYEKVREEVAKAFGFEDGWESDTPEREQRAAGIPVVIGGRRLTISLGPSGLPLTDLNEFPTTGSPVKQADEWINRAMSLVTPGIKTPIELWSNFSFFFRDQIERDEGPLVPAPEWAVTLIPAKQRKQLGFVPDYVDKRTGKKQWGAPAKVVYAMNVLPGPLGFLNRITTPSERPGQSGGAKALGYLGVRAVPVDPVSNTIELLYEERDKVDKRMRALNQRGVSAQDATPEYRALSAREKDITSHIFALRTKRGDKILPGGKQPAGSGPERWEIVRPEKSAGESWQILR